MRKQNLLHRLSGWSVSPSDDSDDSDEWEPLAKCTLWTWWAEYTTTDAEIRYHEDGDTAGIRLPHPEEETDLPADLEGVAVLASTETDTVRDPADAGDGRDGPRPVPVETHVRAVDKHILTIAV